MTPRHPGPSLDTLARIIRHPQLDAIINVDSLINTFDGARTNLNNIVNSSGTQDATIHVKLHAANFQGQPLSLSPDMAILPLTLLLFCYQHAVSPPESHIGTWKAIV